MFNFSGNCQTVIQSWLYHFTSPPAVDESSSFSTSSPTLGLWYLLVVITLVFLWLMILNIFSCIYLPSIHLFWWCISSDLLPFFICGCFPIIEFWELFIYFREVSYIKPMVCSHFPRILWLAFLFCWQCLLLHKILKFSQSPICLFFLLNERFFTFYIALYWIIFKSFSALQFSKVSHISSHIIT